MKLRTIVLFLIFGFNLQVFAQADETISPIIFIYDASGSMWGQLDGKTKMEIAAEVLSESVNKLPEGQLAGLVAYGHRYEGDCEDVEFLVDIESGSKMEVIQGIQGIKPLGKTPLAFSAIQVIDKLRQSKQKATIILVTDGIESCGGNICDVVTAARSEGIDFKLHIIGFGLKDADVEQLKCAAAAGDGNYYTAGDAGGLSDVLEEATATTVDEPAANFSVYAVKNNIAIDAWVKAYDINSKRKPIMVRTYRDTGYFYLPPSTYNFEVEPLEGSDVNMITVYDVQSSDDRIGHKTVSFDGGKLAVTTTNNGENWDCIVKLYDQSGKVAASVRTYTSPKEVEVNPGIYRVTVQALALEGVDTETERDSIVIEPGGVTPISFNFRSGSFEISTRVGADNIDTIVTIKEKESGKKVAAARTYTKGADFLLNPGSYEVKVQPLGVHKDRASQTISIEIKPGEMTSRELSF